MTPCQAMNIALNPDDEDKHKKPDVSNLRVFGCRAYVNIPKERRVQAEKFVPRAQIGKLIGYKSHSIYKIYLIDDGRVVETPHVTFNESLIDDLTVEEEDGDNRIEVTVDPDHSLDNLVPDEDSPPPPPPESPRVPKLEPTAVPELNPQGRRGSSLFRDII